jgi:hypothetical protein
MKHKLIFPEDLPSKKISFSNDFSNEFIQVVNHKRCEVYNKDCVSENNSKNSSSCLFYLFQNSSLWLKNHLHKSLSTHFPNELTYVVFEYSWDQDCLLASNLVECNKQGKMHQKYSSKLIPSMKTINYQLRKFLNKNQRRIEMKLSKENILEVAQHLKINTVYDITSFVCPCNSFVCPSCKTSHINEGDEYCEECIFVPDLDGEIETEEAIKKETEQRHNSFDSYEVCE